MTERGETISTIAFAVGTNLGVVILIVAAAQFVISFINMLTE